MYAALNLKVCVGVGGSHTNWPEWQIGFPEMLDVVGVQQNERV